MKVIKEEKGWSRDGFLKDAKQVDKKQLNNVLEKRQKYYAVFVYKKEKTGEIKYSIDTQAYDSLRDVKAEYSNMSVGAVKSSFEFIPFK